MEIKRLLQVGLILSVSVATPVGAMIINDGGASEGIDTWGINSSIPKKATRIVDWRAFGPIDWSSFNSSPLSNGVKLSGDGVTASDETDSNGGTHEVPEPGMLGLLGSGLIGSILGRRRIAA